MSVLSRKEEIMTIELHDVLEPIAKAIMENPDRSNNGECVYVRNDQPNCIAAVSFAANGVSISDLKMRNISRVLGFVDDGKLDISQDAACALNELQDAADDTPNEPWIACWIRAHREHPSIVPSPFGYVR
jgi:hypothetical protein